MNGIITRRDVYNGTGGTKYLSQIMDKTITEIDDASITEIHTPLFLKCVNLSSVNLRNCHVIKTYLGTSGESQIASIAYDGRAPFWDCSNLQYVSLPSLSSFIWPGGDANYIDPNNSRYTYRAPFARLPVNTMYLSGEMSYIVAAGRDWSAGGNQYRLFVGMFYGMTSLMSLYLMFSSVPSIVTYGADLGDNIFSFTPIHSSVNGVYGSIYVPASLIDTYKAATYWKNYSNRFVEV